MTTSEEYRPAPAPARGRRRFTAYIPPQHGAWAFLVVPLLVGFAVAGWTVAGGLLALAWIVAYPVTYFLGRALTVRVRRGNWSRLARRELQRSLPWLVVLAVLAVPLLLVAPWLVVVAAVLGLAWLVSLALAARFGERSLITDLALVGQAVCAVPIMWAVVVAGSGWAPLPAGSSIWDSLAAAPAAVWLGTAAVGMFLFGSVLQVKSLLRQAGNRGFHWINVSYHALALLAWAAVSPAWLLGFLPALLRALLVRPVLRPAVIGAIETVASLFFVAAAFVAL